MTLPLPMETITEGTIALPGQQDRFTFHAQLGQRFLYDALDDDEEGLVAQLLAPSGQSIWEIDAGHDGSAFYTTESGVYTLLIRAWGNAVGDYQFRMLDLDQSPAFDVGAAVSGQLDPSVQTQAHRFTGTAGQRLRLQMLSATVPNAYWSLLAPHDHIIATSPITSSLGDITLLTSGNYWVLVQGLAAGHVALDYRFQATLVGEPTGVASGFDRLLAGSLQPGESHSYLYTAPAGMQVYLDHQGGRGSWLWADLLASDNSVVFSAWALADFGPVTLPSSGDYTLRVRADHASDTASYKLQLVDINAVATDVTPGSVITGIVDPPNAIQVYRFPAAPGQRFYFDLFNMPPGEVDLQVIGPSGMPPFQSWWWTEDYYRLATEPGVHHLFVQNRDGRLTPYQFRMADFSSVPVLELNSPVTGVLESARAAHLFQFHAEAGQRLFFDTLSHTFNAKWFLVSPTDQLLSDQYLQSDFVLDLLQTGIYRMVVANLDEAPNPYMFEVVDAKTTPQTLVMGSTVEAFITSRAEQLQFSFQGQIGQRLYYDGLQTALQNLQAHLIRPDGEILFSLSHTAFNSAPCTLPLSGEYKLVIGGDTDQTGAFAFRLVDVAQPPAEPLALDQTITGVLSASGDSALYTFYSHAGQQLVFESLLPSMANWVIYDGDNQYVASSSMHHDQLVTLIQAGLHLLVIDAANASPGDFAFALRTIIPTIKMPIDTGEVVTGNIERPGMEARYTFPGHAGMQIYYDAQFDRSDTLPIRLLDPHNLVMFESYSSHDSGPIQLRHPGTYTLVIGGTAGPPGSYQFRILDLASAPVFNDLFTGQLAPALSTQLLRFDATAGQRILLQQLSPGGQAAEWFVLAPSGYQVAYADFNASLPEFQVSLDGNYLIVIRGWGIETPPPYTLRRTTTEPSGIPTGFGTLHAGEIAFAETHVFHFTAPAGLLVYFDWQSIKNTVLEMHFGSVAGTVVYSGQIADDAGPWVLPDSGDYLLTIRGQLPTATGIYRFRLLNLPADSTIAAFGSDLVASLQYPFESQAFQFHAEPGQCLYFDALSPELAADVTLLGIDTTGQSMIMPWNRAFTDSGPFWISAPGTGYIIFNKNFTDPTECRFRLLDLSQHDAPPVYADQIETSSLDPGTRVRLYQLISEGSDELMFRSSSLVNDFFWNVYDPGWTQVVGGRGAGDYTIHLHATNAPYLLLLNGIQQDSVPYSIQFKTPTSTSSALTLNSIVNGSLQGGGEHRFTFHGYSGQTLYYDAMRNDFRWLQVDLRDPHDRVIFTVSSFYDHGPLILPETGEYTLLQRNRDFESIDFRFRIIDADQQPSLPFDIRIDQLLETGFATQLYKVPAMASLPIFFEGLDSNSTGWWTLFDPLGNYLGANALHASFQATPRWSATHWLAVQNQESAPLPYSIRAIPSNHPPALQPIPDQIMDEETTLEILITADDVELPNDRHQFSLASTAPEGAAIDPKTGLFRWTPREDQGPGTYRITVGVADDGIPSLSNTFTFNIQVREINRAPTLTVAPQTLHAGGTLQLPLPVLDPDLPRNTVTLSLLSAPPGASLDSQQAHLTWRSTESDAGHNYPVILQVTDDGSPPLMITPTFSIFVVQPLRLEATAIAEHSITLSWWSIEGHQYRVEYRDELSGQEWSSFPETIPGTGAPTAATDLVSPVATTRFYRVSDLGPVP